MNVPDWYLAATIRSIGRVAPALDDRQLLQVWYAYFAAAPTDHEDEQ